MSRNKNAETQANIKKTQIPSRILFSVGVDSNGEYAVILSDTLQDTEFCKLISVLENYLDTCTTPQEEFWKSIPPS